jgi:hypothetical protein
MLTSKQYALLAGVIFLLVLVAGIWYVSQQQKNPSLDQRLAECGSLPNGSTQNVVETTRMFINIPKDLYPNVNLQITSNGATASYISNGGPYGSAIGGQGKPNCWSYYFEFDGTGTVDFASKSGMSGVPDYLAHFIVTASTTTSVTDTGPIVGVGKHCGGFIRNAPVCSAGLHCQLAISNPDTGGTCVANEPAGGIHGTVMLGPSCPVMRNPPDPQCADKPYQTSITVSHAGSPSVVFATAQSAVDGTFTLSLPPGNYIISAAGGTSLPRCSNTSATVGSSGYTQIQISCDTGIR